LYLEHLTMSGIRTRSFSDDRQLPYDYGHHESFLNFI
jgi:hypothetical protein